MIMISNFLFNFIDACVIVILDILFSKGIRAVVVAKLVILGIWCLNSFILALIEAMLAKLEVLGILPLA